MFTQCPTLSLSLSLFFSPSLSLRDDLTICCTRTNRKFHCRKKEIFLARSQSRSQSQTRTRSRFHSHKGQAKCSANLAKTHTHNDSAVSQKANKPFARDSVTAQAPKVCATNVVVVVAAHRSQTFTHIYTHSHTAATAAAAAGP